MRSLTQDWRSSSLARGGPRRWAVKMLVGVALGVGIVHRGQHTAAAFGGDRFEQCYEACRASCGEHHHCPSPEQCAASCSQAEW